MSAAGGRACTLTWEVRGCRSPLPSSEAPSVLQHHHNTQSWAQADRTGREAGREESLWSEWSPGRLRVPTGLPGVRGVEACLVVLTGPLHGPGKPGAWQAGECRGPGSPGNVAVLACPQSAPETPAVPPFTSGTSPLPPVPTTDQRFAPGAEHCLTWWPPFKTQCRSWKYLESHLLLKNPKIYTPGPGWGLFPWGRGQSPSGPFASWTCPSLLSFGSAVPLPKLTLSW